MDTCTSVAQVRLGGRHNLHIFRNNHEVCRVLLTLLLTLAMTLTPAQHMFQYYIRAANCYLSLQATPQQVSYPSTHHHPCTGCIDTTGCNLGIEVIQYHVCVEDVTYHIINANITVYS